MIPHPLTHSAVVVVAVQLHIDWTRWTWPVCCRVPCCSLARQRGGERSRCQTGTACRTQHIDLVYGGRDGRGKFEVILQIRVLLLTPVSHMYAIHFGLQKIFIILFS